MAGDGSPRTALTKYQRLESTGLWRATPGAQRREVVVRMGEATLMLNDPRSEAVLGHWSLPAVRRLNPGIEPASYSPDEGAGEELELADADMIAALDAVQRAVRAGQPRQGRLRGWLGGGTVLVVLALAIVVMPRIFVAHTASVVPPAKRAEIGQEALDDLSRLTGPPCSGERGLPVLAALAERVFGPVDTPILYILPEGLNRPAHLPGRLILLPRSLIETDGPEALAGAALAEEVAATQEDPMRPVLDHAGLRATFALLTSGTLPAGALAGYGEVILRRPVAPPDAPALAEAFSRAKVPFAPYAHWLDPGGKSAPDAAGPGRQPAESLRALMSDDEWIVLQSVCAG